MDWFRSIWRWVGSWFRRKPRPLIVEWCSDMPEDSDRRKLYLVGEGEHLWFAVFTCPCGCGELVQLSLLKDSRPSWRVTVHANNTATIHPSVWRQRGCRSHFFVRQGQIQWVD